MWQRACLVSLVLDVYMFSLCIIVSGPFSLLERGREQLACESRVARETFVFLPLWQHPYSLRNYKFVIFVYICSYSSSVQATDRFINLEINQSMLYSYTSSIVYLIFIHLDDSPSAVVVPPVVVLASSALLLRRLQTLCSVRKRPATSCD
jgi:hypothetical protein